MPQIEVEVVSYANSQFLLEVALRAEDCTTADLMFSSEELARKAAIELAKDFKWVQISEWGEWNNHNKRPQSGWIAFWWTDACGTRDRLQKNQAILAYHTAELHCGATALLKDQKTTN